MHIPDSARHVLESASPAHIATINPDGSPHLTMVWVAVDGEELFVPHLHRYRKLDNIQRDPRVALTVQADSVNAMGLQEYVLIRGRATVKEGGAPELLARLAPVYRRGQSVQHAGVERPSVEQPPGFVTRITPDYIGGVGPWAERHQWEKRYGG